MTKADAQGCWVSAKFWLVFVQASCSCLCVVGWDVEMGEDGVASRGRMMEEIGAKLPRFDECISLLRAEIDELKAGKHDHRLREVVANPLDPDLHAVLAKGIDGGLLLPPAPALSDSDGECAEDEDSHSNAGSTDEVVTSDFGAVSKGTPPATSAQGAKGAAADRRDKRTDSSEAEGDVELQVVVDVDGQKEEDVLVVPVGGGEDSKKKEKTTEGGKGERPKRGCTGDESRTGTPHRTKESRAVGATPPSESVKPNRDSSKRNGGSAVASTPTSTKARNCLRDDFGGAEKAVVAGAEVSLPTNNHHRRTHASPLRDRPPIHPGGTANANRSAAPNTVAPPSSKHHPTSKASDENGGTRKSERGDRDSRSNGNNNSNSIGGDSGDGGDGIVVGSGVPGSPALRRDGKSSGDAAGVNGQEEETGAGKNSGGGRVGRKRPRSEGGAGAEKSRDRRPRSSRRDGGDGGTDEDEEESSDKAGERPVPNRDLEHFRRIALEVWERVNKHKFAIIFRKPVNPKDAPGYEKVIKKPMDLSLIRERIISGALASLDDMSRDLFVMCNNAMVFNGAGDPYFDYSKELRTYASEVIEEARRPGFVTADPGFDSVVAGARTSRRPPDMLQAGPATSARSNNARGKSRKGSGGGSGSRSSAGRDSDSASIADSVGTGDESGRGRRGGGSRGSAGGSSVDGDAREKRRGGGSAKKKKAKAGARRGGGSKSRAPSDDWGESAGVGSSVGGSSEDEEEEGDEEHSPSESEGSRTEKRGKKKRIVARSGSRKKRVRREVSDDSSDDEPSVTRGKSRKTAKPVVKSKGRAKKRK